MVRDLKIRVEDYAVGAAVNHGAGASTCRHRSVLARVRHIRFSRGNQTGQSKRYKTARGDRCTEFLWLAEPIRGLRRS